MATYDVLQALDKFRVIDRDSIDSVSLVESARSSLMIIEPWNHASSNVPEAEETILRIQILGDKYVDALSLSLDTAKQALTLSGDTASLFEQILDENVELADIKVFIRELVKIALAAEKKCKTVSSKFQRLGRKVDEITNDLPAMISELTIQEEKAHAQVKAVQKRTERTKVIKACSTAALAVVGGVAIVAFPPVLLMMPVMLPVIVLASELVEWRSKKQLIKREAQLRDYSDAIRDLQGASTSLAKLGNGIALFGDFWMDMQIRLEDLSTRLHLLRGSSAYKCRLRAVISTWNDLTDKFRNYATNLQRLHDIYYLYDKDPSRGSSIAEAEAVSNKESRSRGVLRRHPAEKVRHEKASENHSKDSSRPSWKQRHLDIYK